MMTVLSRIVQFIHLEDYMALTVVLIGIIALLLIIFLAAVILRR